MVSVLVLSLISGELSAAIKPLTSTDPTLLNVLDFGAIRNDNASDSTAAFQSALNAAASQSVRIQPPPSGSR
jgi:polygalacturonase